MSCTVCRFEAISTDESSRGNTSKNPSAISNSEAGKAPNPETQ
jgi:hypothetical protein